MKKKIGIPIVVMAVFIILAVGYYFMPKTFGKNVNPSEVSQLQIWKTANILLRTFKAIL